MVLTACVFHVFCLLVAHLLSLLFAGGDLEKQRDCALTVTCGDEARGETVQLLLVAPDVATQEKWVTALSALV